MVSTVPRQGLIYFHPFRLDSVSITRELSQIDIASTTLSQIHMTSTTLSQIRMTSTTLSQTYMAPGP